MKYRHFHTDSERRRSCPSGAVVMGARRQTPHMSGRSLAMSAILTGVLTMGIGCARTVEKSEADSAPVPTAGRASEIADRLVQGRISFALPEPESWTLSNGLRVLYIFDDELPEMKGKLYVQGGSLFDPEGRAGLFDAIGSQLREGSIEGIQPDELDTRLDALAASISTDYQADTGTISFSCLSEDFGAVFPLFAGVVRKPAFDAHRLELWKSVASDGIRRRNDDSDTMALSAASVVVYGEKSAFARQSTIASVQHISRVDLLSTYKKFVRPNGAILVITGALPKEEVQHAIDRELGSWPQKTDPLPLLPTVEGRKGRGIYVLERDFNQSVVMLGHVGPPRYVPDIYEMSVFNRTYGYGGFGAKLFGEVRTKLGLAYSISGGINPGPVKGTFLVSLGTRNEELVTALRRTLELTDEALAQLPAPQQFDEAKSAVENSFVFKFDSPLAVLNRTAQRDLFGYPADFDSSYLAHIEQVTPERALGVAQRWIHPDDFGIVIVGRSSPAQIKAAFPDWPVYQLTFDEVAKIGPEVK